MAQSDREKKEKRMFRATYGGTLQGQQGHDPLQRGLRTILLRFIPLGVAIGIAVGVAAVRPPLTWGFFLLAVEIALFGVSVYFFLPKRS